MDDLLSLKEQGKGPFIGISNPDCRCDTALPLIQSGLIVSWQTIFNIFYLLHWIVWFPLPRHNLTVIAEIKDVSGLSGFLTEDTKFDKSKISQDIFRSCATCYLYGKGGGASQIHPHHASSLNGFGNKICDSSSWRDRALTSMHVPTFSSTQNIAVMDEEGLSEEVLKRSGNSIHGICNSHAEQIGTREAVGGSIGKK